MRKKLAAFALVGLLTGGVVAMNLAPAEATHTYRHLVRQINRLENNVATLKSQVRELQHDIFVCELVAENLTFNTPTGTYTDNFVVYDTTTCPLAAAASGKIEART
jgi:hypothetical protein